MKRSFRLTLASVDQEGEQDVNSREIEAEVFVVQISKDKRTATFAYVFEDGGNNILIHGRDVKIEGATNIFDRGLDYICEAAHCVGLEVCIKEQIGSKPWPGNPSSSLVNLVISVLDETAAPWLSWE